MLYFEIVLEMCQHWPFVYAIKSIFIFIFLGTTALHELGVCIDSTSSEDDTLMAAILSVKTQECTVGVRPDGLYTMDARPKKQGHLHKDIVAEVRYPSGTIIVKQKGEGYVLHVNTCTTIELSESVSSNSPWLCSVNAGTMCNDIYMNGDIIGRKIRNTVTSPTGISVKFDSGSVLIEEDADNYITTTETTFSDKKICSSEKKSRKRAGGANDHVPTKTAKADAVTEFAEPGFTYSLQDLLHCVGLEPPAEQDPVLVPYSDSQAEL